MNRKNQLVILMAAGIGILSARVAQAQSCKAPDTLASNVAYELRRIASNDNTLRDKLRLPLAKPNQVVLVSDTAICTRVRQALDSMIKSVTPDPINLGPRPIYTIRVGSHYAAINPGSQAGEFTPVFIFDSRFTYLSMLAF
jgi:hypothetical protein